MTVIVPAAPSTQAVRDIRLGPLRFVTTFDDLKETLGDGLEAAGPMLTAGERKPRPFTLSLPVRGENADPDPRADGERLRRQVRALLENAPARLEGLYLAIDWDTDLNGWYLIGGGELEYAPGGPSFSEYKLTLTDMYRIGSPRTHRPARRLTAVDRRQEAIPKDLLERVYVLSSYEGATAAARHYLPAGATDHVRSGGRPVPEGTAITGGGETQALLQSHVHGEVVSYEHLEEKHLVGDVEILTSVDGEAVFGPDQPLQPGTVPALQNGVARVHWIADRSAFALDEAISGDQWAERARFTLHATAGINLGTLVGARVVEWTPERAIVCAVLTGAGARIEAYLTLQRGWAGPRLDAYAAGTANPVQVTARLVPIASGASSVILGGLDGFTPITDGTSYQWEPEEPWLSLVPASPALPLAIAPAFPDQNPVEGVGPTVRGRVGVTQAYGAARTGLDIAQPNNEAPDFGWIGLQLETGRPRASADGDAQELGRATLIDARTTPTLVAR